MQKTVSFKKKVIATTIASLAAGFGSMAYAQDNGGETEEIVVTGIKASLTRAMDIKRDAAGVVDAISAEDIGKMPDTNLAESLQRITGVSIDRSNGEGSKVTVRGLAGDYNLVTLNGRQMPASTVGNSSASASRSFDFANLASEGVAGVEVYKTGRADVASGGMGALINIITPHPLKNPGLKASVGVKGVFDQSSENSDVTPEVSGLYSNTFADDKVGISVTGSYQERNSGDRQAYVGGWFTHDKTGAGDWAGIPAENQPAGKTYSFPVNVGYSYSETNRKRLNGQATLQFKPVDTLTVTADYLYVNQETEAEKHSTGMWFTRGSNLAIQWSDTNPAYPLSYTEQTGVHDLDSSMSLAKRKSDLKSAGLNVEWDVTDHLKLELDGHNSTSFAGPNGKYGSENGFDSAVFKDYKVTLDNTRDFPVLNVKNADGSTTVIPDVSKSQLSGNTFKNSSQDSEVDEYQLKGTYTFDDSILKSIKAGAGANEITNKSFYIGIQQQNQGSWSGVQEANGVGDIPAEYWTVDHLSSHFDNGAAHLSSFQNAFIRSNWKDLLAKGAELYGSNTGGTQAYPCAKAYCAVMDPALANDGFADQQTVEKSTYEYIQFNLHTDLGSMPANLSIGVRHEATEVDSKSYLATYKPEIRWNGGNEYALQPTGRGYLSGEGDYSKTLPSADFDLSVTDEVKVRASASKTISRPNYNDIKGGFEYGASPRVGQGSANAGNPDLDPLESTNFDLSVEWYYGDASYVSAGYFKKDVVDFIGSAPTVVTDSGFHTPVNGPRWKAALASGAKTDNEIRDYIIANYPGSVDATNKWVYALPEDPILPFQVTRPVNNKDVAIHGVELAIQHTFGESGFGVQANATKVDSDTSFDNTSVATQFAIYGLSDSANLVAFYDKDAWQARIAYNWRDEFLAGIGDSAGANPVYVEAYGQVDATVSYEFNENLTVTLEGLNITDETRRTHGRDSHMVLNYIEMGARYNLGVRYTF